MKLHLHLGCGLLFITGVSAYTLVTKVTPVQKVLQMMGEMKATSEKMMDSEEKTFNKYTNWARGQKQELGLEIGHGKSEIEKLTSFIEQADLDVQALIKEIAGIDKDLDGMKMEMAESTKLRKKEHAEYSSTQEDLAESVEALREAMEVVKNGAKDEDQASALLQQSYQKMGDNVREALAPMAAYLEEQDLGAPKAAAYKEQSGGVLKMLEGLEVKFKKELDECELEESNKAHAYDLELQHLTDTVNAVEADRSEKQAEKGKTEAESAKAKGVLSKTKAELAEDEKMLVEVTSTYKTKKAMFDENHKTRKEELAAIDKAIQIISSPEVSGSASLTQANQVTSLLQTQSSNRRVAARQRLSRFLERRAQLLSSNSLKNVAGQLATTPFTKVIQLIKDLIAKLKEEASAEAERKTWCDEQLKANKLKRSKETTSVDKLAASVEKLTGEIDTMAKEIATLSAEQADLTKAMSKATEIRSEEKIKNTETVKDAVQGAEALKQALKVLKTFYSSHAFLQQAPEMDKYGGQQGKSKGVVGMLEVIQSDFLRLKAETSADEAQAVREYDKFMIEAKKNMQEKHDKEFKLKLNKDKAENEKSDTSKDLALSSDGLDKAEKYHDFLKPACSSAHETYEDRTAKRKEEIDALKQALEMLDNM